MLAATTCQPYSTLTGLTFKTQNLSVTMSNISDIRKDYSLQVLQEKDVHSNPMQQFNKWWQEALESQIDEVNAMTLATANKDGKPSARIVLLKGVEDDGFVFYTNYNSNKGKEIAENPSIREAYLGSKK